MAVAPETAIMALYCDFENVALGVRDAKYDRFDIKPVLERLLLKGSIVVKKAYCDWERYKGFKSTMHEASFELIEIPHLRQSGKNSADIRLVVDALDLCYTKSHVDTFVIISGDSDFSPLVSKLRENAKYVIGVGVKQSTSDLLIGNCDEFIFYDDLVREMQRAARRDSREAAQATRRTPEEDAERRAELEARRSKAIELAVATFDAMVDERGDSGKIWASMLKEAIKRRKPDFNESYYGFRAFGNLLEEAQARGLLAIGRDEKSGTYVFRRNGLAAAGESGSEVPLDETRDSSPAPLPEAARAADEPAGDAAAGAPAPRRKSEGRRKAVDKGGKRGARAPKDAGETGVAAVTDVLPAAEAAAAVDRSGTDAEPAASAPPPVAVAADDAPAVVPEQAAAAQPAAVGETGAAGEVGEVGEEGKAGEEGVAGEVGEVGTAADAAAVPSARKPAARPRRPRKPKVPVDVA
ncbi:NYN domain-containing protein [Accumulibacter sp.]|uniref:NYN domain-containing protein n=1 Tax=Accumulibacter sp. TaxID=2053492 RepID=UPI0025F459CE|nr:NYN domain-containing protein [Accumulibacter sp.]MCM8613634.1 NYN domain-containing protein [Accumulibacter sp.]MCM8637338.1 NYN domain-containing protein [Accumulibacter sp.]MCM8638944.1 NYN domain-containing protein [Accumulibacter sp.]